MTPDILWVFGFVLIALAFHPFTTYPLSLRLLSSRPQPTPTHRGAATSRPLSFSLLSCTHNEERCANALIRNRMDVAALRQSEILIYDDHSSDWTSEMLAANRQHLTFVQGQARLGKTHGMNHLAKLATGDILVFSDANVVLAKDILERLEWYFRDPQVGCVCGHLIYVNGETSATAAVGSDYWQTEEQIKALESATGSSMGADGSLFAVRRYLHQPVPDNLIDDMYLSLSILIDGHRVIRAPDVLAFEHSASGAMDEFKRKMRIACQAFNVHRVLGPKLSRVSLLDRYKYTSHKLLRWLMPFTATGGAFLLLAAFALQHGVTAMLAAVFAVIALGLFVAFAKPQSVRIFLNLLLALGGVACGIAQSLLGRTYRTWQPAASVRS